MLYMNSTRTLMTCALAIAVGCSEKPVATPVAVDVPVAPSPTTIATPIPVEQPAAPDTPEPPVAVVDAPLEPAAVIELENPLPLPSELDATLVERRWNLLTADERAAVERIRSSLVTTRQVRLSCQDFLFVYVGDGWPFANAELRVASSSLGHLVDFVSRSLQLSLRESLELRRQFDREHTIDPRKAIRPLDSVNLQGVELFRVIRFSDDSPATDDIPRLPTGANRSIEIKNVPRHLITDFGKMAIIAHVISTGDRALTDDEIVFARDMAVLRDRVAEYVKRPR